VLQFVDNSTPRPGTFCGNLLNNAPYGDTAYNNAWSAYLTALQNYLSAHGLLGKTYYYVQNEPQNLADYTVSAFLCKLTRQASPNLKIMLSREANPQIAENPTYPGCGYDIWLAPMGRYQQIYAWQREQLFGEKSWFYSLDQDLAPFLNPTVLGFQGWNALLLTTVAWSQRIRGWAFYNPGQFFTGTQANVRAELLRESFDIYDYLVLANGGVEAAVNSAVAVDALVQAVAQNLNSYITYDSAVFELKKQIGLALDAGQTVFPQLYFVHPSANPRQAYYIDFKGLGNPAGPVVQNGVTWLEVDWIPFDPVKGYGWTSPNINNVGSILLNIYDTRAVNYYGAGEVEATYLYDDFGRVSRFDFLIANGLYQITVGVGRPDRPSYDIQNAWIEGVHVVNEFQPPGSSPTMDTTGTLLTNVTDSCITLLFGGHTTDSSVFQSTFIQYVTIIPV